MDNGGFGSLLAYSAGAVLAIVAEALACVWLLSRLRLPRWAIIFLGAAIPSGLSLGPLPERILRALILGGLALVMAAGYAGLTSRLTSPARRKIAAACYFSLAAPALSLLHAFLLGAIFQANLAHTGTVGASVAALALPCLAAPSKNGEVTSRRWRAVFGALAITCGIFLDVFPRTPPAGASLEQQPTSVQLSESDLQPRQVTDSVATAWMESDSTQAGAFTGCFVAVAEMADALSALSLASPNEVATIDTAGAELRRARSKLTTSLAEVATMTGRSERYILSLLQDYLANSAQTSQQYYELFSDARLAGITTPEWEDPNPSRRCRALREQYAKVSRARLNEIYWLAAAQHVVLHDGSLRSHLMNRLIDGPNDQLGQVLARGIGREIDYFDTEVVRAASTAK